MMFTISVSILKADLPSYSREIELVEVDTPTLFEAAAAFKTIKDELDRLRDMLPEPAVEVNKLQLAQDAVCALNGDEQAAFEKWMQE